MREENSVKSEDELLNALAHEVAQNAAEDFRESCSSWLSKCQSPIERVLGAALLARPLEEIDPFTFTQPADPDVLFRHFWRGTSDYVGSLHAQVPLGHYVVDFYLQAFQINNWTEPRGIIGQWLKLVIECDGHDYHERTKEQARSDKRRDRWFQTHGFTVLRFTGSEIWADPLGCVDQIHDAFFAAWHRYTGR